MRRAWTAIALVVLASCTDDGARRTQAARATSASATVTGSIALASGANGPVTTLATYPGGVAHPGVNAVDIAAAGGAPVFHQLGRLPADVAGGWVHVYASHEPGTCAQWLPGSPYHNGSKLAVVTYFYATDGTYRGWHRAAYQHVVAAGAGRWLTWNNASASKRAWGSAEVSLGSGPADGLFLGTVFVVTSPITNGPGGGLCTSGSHLHQESDGARGASLFTGKVLAARFDDVHVFGLAAGLPRAGAPPSPPAFD